MKARHHTGVKAALIVTPDGNCQCLHTEVISLEALGDLKISRATDIVFDNDTQLWEVWGGVGHALYGHPSRQACLDWERLYIEEKQDMKHGGIT
jgi:hypothetical protein